MKCDILDFEEKVVRVEFELIKVWFRERIYCWGSIYLLKEFF